MVVAASCGALVVGSPGGVAQALAVPASGRRTGWRSSTRTASSTSRCSSARRCSTPCASTSTGAWPRRRSQYIVNDAEAKVLVVGPDFVPVLDAIVDQLTDGDEDRRHRRSPDARDYEEWIGAVSGRRSRRAVDRRRRRVPALLLGHDRASQGRDADATTTSSRCCRWPRTCGSSTRDSVNLVAMPLFHIGGGGWAMAGMYEGATSVHRPRPRPGGAGQD